MASVAEIRKELEASRAERERQEREGQEREDKMVRDLARVEAIEKQIAKAKAQEVRREAEERRRADEIAENITKQAAREALRRRRQDLEREKEMRRQDLEREVTRREELEREKVTRREELEREKVTRREELEREKVMRRDRDNQNAEEAQGTENVEHAEEDGPGPCWNCRSRRIECIRARTCNSCVAEKLRCAPTDIESRNMEKGKEKDRQVVGMIRREGSEMAEVLVRVEEMMEKMEKMAEDIRWLKRLVKQGFRKNREEMHQVQDRDWEKQQSEDETERSEVEAAMNAMLPDDEEPM